MLVLDKFHIIFCVRRSSRYAIHEIAAAVTVTMEITAVTCVESNTASLLPHHPHSMDLTATGDRVSGNEEEGNQQIKNSGEDAAAACGTKEAEEAQEACPRMLPEHCYWIRGIAEEDCTVYLIPGVESDSS